jgi:hypothetical protein
MVVARFEISNAALHLILYLVILPQLSLKSEVTKVRIDRSASFRVINARRQPKSSHGIHKATAMSKERRKEEFRRFCPIRIQKRKLLFTFVRIVT